MHYHFSLLSICADVGSELVSRNATFPGTAAINTSNIVVSTETHILSFAANVLRRPVRGMKRYVNAFTVQNNTLSESMQLSPFRTLAPM